jgi:hypothetical protein
MDGEVCYLIACGEQYAYGLPRRVLAVYSTIITLWCQPHYLILTIGCISPFITVVLFHVIL